MAALPHALLAFDQVLSTLRGKLCVVFLDYDGTLASIVRNPDEAFLTDATRDAVDQLSRRCTVSIVSGRARAKVSAFVRLDQLFFAGSHGFDICGPEAWPLRHRVAEEHLPALMRVKAALQERLAAVAGASVEDNSFSVTVHYRQAAPESVPGIEAEVDRALAAEGDASIVKRHGKKVLELRPNVEWHKGKAVRWLLGALGLGAEEERPTVVRDDVAVVYLGDDVTDEDAFREIKQMAAHSVCCIVSEAPDSRPTAANFALRDPAEVREFLVKLAAAIPEGSHVPRR